MRDEPYDIFVSYARTNDPPRVYALVSLLEMLDRDLRIFVDHREIPNGQSFNKTISKEVQSARMVLGAISEDAARSRAVAWECGQGHARDALTMVLIGNRPKDWVQGWYPNPQETQWTDLSRCKMEVFDPAFQEFAELIAKRLDRPALRESVDWLRRSLAGRMRSDNGDGKTLTQVQWRDLIRATQSLDTLNTIRTLFRKGPVREMVDQQISIFEANEHEARTWSDGLLRGTYIFADTVDGTPFRDGDGLPVMVTIPDGSFPLQTVSREDGKVMTTKHIRFDHRFAVSQHLLTFAQWDFALANGLHQFLPDAQRKDSRGLDHARYPLFDVSWNEARAYCLWATWLTGMRYRLLSEAEWEYCCCAGVYGKRFHFGDRLTETQASFGRARTVSDKLPLSPIGSFPPNRFQLFDLHGNLWEWVEDPWQGGISSVPANGRARTEGSRFLRTVRGGSWANHVALLASDSRSYREASARDEVTGIRIARDISTMTHRRSMPDRQSFEVRR